MKLAMANEKIYQLLKSGGATQYFRRELEKRGYFEKEHRKTLKDYQIKTLGRSKNAAIQCDTYNAILNCLQSYVPDITIGPPSALDFSTSERQPKKIINHFPDPFFSSKNNLSFLLQDANFYPPTCMVHPDWSDEKVTEVLTQFIAGKYHEKKADKNHGMILNHICQDIK